MKRYLPNSVTLLNLFLGCLSVVIALQGHLYLSGIIIGVCAVLDFLDGFLARILNAGSPLGQQLDSLADLISFGMAPAAIMFFYMVHASPVDGSFSAIPYLAFLITVFSGLRLAIFNIDTRQSSSFIGLPTPANAIFFASIPVVLTYGARNGIIFSTLQSATSSIWILLALIAFFSWLLVSPIRMFSLKFTSLKWSGNQIRIIFIIVALVLFLIFQLNSIPVVVIFYIILSTVQHFSTKVENNLPE